MYLQLKTPKLSIRRALPLIIHRVLLLFVLGGIALNLSAQEFKITTLPTHYLLPASACYVFQDSEGYLWYGTRQAGVCRDNGYQLDVFSPSNISHDAASNFIICISEAADGSILIGTAHGLFALSKKDYLLRAIAPTDQKIESLLTDSHGQTWVGMNGTVCRLGVADNGRGEGTWGTDSASIKSFACSTTPHGKPINRLFEDSHGTIFALEWLGGILQKRRSEATFTPLRLAEPLNPVNIIEDTDIGGSYWVLTRYHGVVKLHVKGTDATVKLNPVTMSDNGRKRGLGFVLDQRHGLLWVTTMDNLYAYSISNEGQLTPYPLDRWIPSERKILDAPFQLRDGSIYVPGSMPQTFIITTDTDPVKRLPFNDIRNVTGYPLQTERSLRQPVGTWMWHQRAGLIIGDAKDSHLVVSPEPLAPWFCADSRTGNSIWASHGGSLYHVSYVDGRIVSRHICGMPDAQEIRGIQEGHESTLFIASNQHVYQLNLISNRLSELFATKGQPMAFNITNHHFFWLSEGHLYMRPLPTEPGDTATRVIEGLERAIAIATDREGAVWAATQDGCAFHYRAATDSLKRIDFMHSNNNAPFLDITVDKAGHVWTVTEQQIREFNPHTRAFRTLKASSPETDVAYFHSVEAQDDNYLCINGAGAICLVEPSAALDQIADIVEPRISAYVIDGQKHYTLSDKSEIRLRPKDSNLDLLLTTLNQPSAGNITFAYRLEGLNHDWIYGLPGDNIIHLNKLPVGSYNLCIRATDANGCWSTPTTLLTIRSLPVWYKTWWAQILEIALILLGTLGIWQLERRIRLLHRLIRRREQVRLNEIELRREDITPIRLNDEFLRKAKQAVEEHLADSGFNVEALAATMCMSRANLHRHMKAQTGLSPTDFIRDIRLKKAAQLFTAHPDVTITDVAARVGFATPKYLSRCFKEKFGVSPREYAEKTPEKEE